MADTTFEVPFEKKGNIVDTLGDDDKKELAELVSKRWFNATTEIRNLIEESREGWDFYLKNSPDLPNQINTMANTMDTENRRITPTRRALRLSLIPKSVDSVMGILHNSLFPADERFFRGTPRNGVAMDNQEIYELYRADNFAQDNTTEELRKYLLTLCIDPAACVSVQWKQRTRKKVLYEAPVLKLAGIEVPLPVLGLKARTEPKFVEWEGTHVECLDFNDWRVDPFARRFEDSWFERRWYLPCWKVEKMFELEKGSVKPYYTNFEDINDVQGNQKRFSYGFTFPIDHEMEPDGKDQALLMICYDDFMIKGTIYENHALVVLNGTDPVWFGPNDYDHGRVPYIITSLLPVPNQIYGLPLIRHAIPSAAVVDTAMDLGLKVASFAANPIFETDMTEPAFKKSRQVKPGLTIPVKRVGNAIRQVPVQCTNLTYLEKFIELCQDNIREITGASAVFTGQDFNQQPANVTAFQVDQHVQGANSRFQAIMTNFSNNVLEVLLYMAFENDKQFKSVSEWVPVSGEQKELSPDLIRQMDFKWVITSANAAITRGKRLENLKFLLTMAPQMAQEGMLQIDSGGKIFKSSLAIDQACQLAGIPNSEQLFSTLPPPPPQPMTPPPGGMLPSGLPGVQPANPIGPGQLPPPAGPAPSIPGPPAQNAGPPVS